MREITLFQCFYCGDESLPKVRDHVRPLALESVSRHYDRRDTVICCSECNRLLGSVPLVTVEERASYLLEKLRRRYRSCLKTEAYSRQELAGLGPHMRSYVAANLSQKRWVIERLENLAHTAMSCFLRHPDLRGITTLEKATAFGILEAFLYDAGPEIIFRRYWADKTSWQESQITRLLREEKHTDVAIAVKVKHRVDFDMPLRKARFILYAQRVAADEDFLDELI